jgi:hypothetical protein
MNDQRDPGDWEVEEMLKQLPIAVPSKRLDARIGELFRPRWKMWIGPIAGFSAGVAATLAVVFMIPHSSKGTTDIGTIHNTGAVQPAAVAPKARPTLLIENQQVRTLDGNVDGHPMRLEYRQPHLIFLQKQENGSLVRTDMALPVQTVMRMVLSN